MFDSTGGSAVVYRLDGGPGAEGEAVGSTGRAGLSSFLAFAERSGVWAALGARVRLPVQERRTGFTQRQKHQALVAALAAGCSGRGTATSCSSRTRRRGRRWGWGGGRTPAS